MSFISPISRIGVPRCGAPLIRSQCVLQHQNVTIPLLARLKSSAARPPIKPAKPASPNNQTIRRRSKPTVDSAKKAAQLLNNLSKSVAAPVAKSKVAPVNATVSTPGEPSPTQSAPPQPASTEPAPMEPPSLKPSRPRISTPKLMMKEDPKPSHEDGGVDFTIDEKEAAIQQRIVVQRRKLLWPGIWTVFALAGTYGTLAYLDVKAGIPSSDGSHLPERVSAQLPQTWYLTPDVIVQGAKAGWKDVDNLTIGIIVATFAIHLLKRSPLPIWERLIHINGEKLWTTFTYPFVNADWKHAATNMVSLYWVLPSVVRYFDGDLFHTSAFLLSAPLITSYLNHFAYRFGISTGLVLNLGASGAIAAAFGAYCVAYANEKLWSPQGVFLRLDAQYWGAVFVAYQTYGFYKGTKGGNRPAFLAHLFSFGLGYAYAYFDLKHHLWIPLVSEISSTQETKTNSRSVEDVKTEPKGVKVESSNVQDTKLESPTPEHLKIEGPKTGSSQTWLSRIWNSK